VPLLFEGGRESGFDTTVSIVAAEGVRRERAAARGHALVDARGRAN
jgi:dephospho-CoA kinase